MPSSRASRKTATTSTRRDAPRRTHLLGSCKTCRRRHVKCDKMQPVCLTCQAMGISCEGFSTGVRWMPSKARQPRQEERCTIGDETTGTPKHTCVNDGVRHHLYTEQTRESMSTELTAGLTSGSIDASLMEIDAKTKDTEWLSTGDIAVGPFSVLNFNSTVTNVNSNNTETGPPGKPNHVSSSSCDSQAPAAGLSPPAVDLLHSAEDLLQWDDLFDFGSDLFGAALPTSLPCIDIGEYNAGIPVCENGTSGIPQRIQHQNLTMHETPGDDQISVQTRTPQQISTDTLSCSMDVLADAPFLLKYFQDHVIAQMMPLPIAIKSPWRVLNIPVAVLTLGELTFFNQSDVNHARMANFLSILACSAYHLGANPSRDSCHSVEYWKQTSNKAYREAKSHIQQSLQTEVYGPRKAKYKDQLMAIEGMSAFAILSCHQKDARCYMIDAERLLRLRGLAKREISRKARFLHHIYTWNRIVGESTYVLHEYRPSESFMNALDHYSRPQLDQLDSINHNQLRQSDHHDPRLDDFLRLRPSNQSDSDLDIDEPKEREAGFHDIHLEDSRRFSETLYSQIYGIPETWLSLLSQTTRLANVLDTVEGYGNSNAKKSMNSEAWEAVQRRAIRLENMICSLALRSSRNVGKTSSTELPDSAQDRPHADMLRALNAALVIFFYRRIRQVHPTILQGHVDDVIETLRDFDVALTESGHPGPGTGWPAFIAGCEAMTPTRRDALLRWIEKAGARSGFAVFGMAKEVMMEAWEEQDKHTRHSSSSNRNSRGDLKPSWVDVLKGRKLWPAFC